MSEYKTMRVPVDAWRAAKDDKESLGLTWGEWMKTKADTAVQKESVGNLEPFDGEVPDGPPQTQLDVMVNAEDAKEELQELKTMAEETKDEIDSLAFNGQVSEETVRRIEKRIDDLESQLPRKVAEEVQSR